MVKTTVVPESHCTIHPLKRICWAAIFAGAVVAIGLGFLLNLFGIAIGLSSMTVKNGATVLAVGGLIGIIIAVIASMMASGYAAGYLGRGFCPQRNLGILYGFLTWTVALILSAFVMIPINQYLVTYSQSISRTSITVSQPKAESTTAAVKSNSASKSENQTNVKVAATPEMLVSSAFILFGVFFIGALFTCLGACWGMACRRED